MTSKDYIVEMLKYRIHERLKIIKGTNNVLDLYIIKEMLDRLSYDELKKIIALEKAKKLGQGHHRKKTLRKRRKAPYANKKSKRR